VLVFFVKRMSQAERAEFALKLRSRGLNLDRPLSLYLQGPPENIDRVMEILAGNLDLLDCFSHENESYLSFSGSPGTLKLARGFAIDETEELARGASDILKAHSLAAVLMGHTHEAVDNRLEGRYINSGCWTRYLRLDANHAPLPWSILQSDSFLNFPYQLHYVETTGSGLPRLITFQERSS
jgi:hypothetical protein